MALILSIRNPLATVLNVNTGTNTRSLKPGDKWTYAVRTDVSRTDGPTTVRAELKIAGLGTIAQEAQIWTDNPLIVSVGPVVGQALPVSISNPSGEEFTGSVYAMVIDGAERRDAVSSLKLERDGFCADLKLTLPSKLSGRYRVGIWIKNENGAQVLRVPTANYFRLYDTQTEETNPQDSHFSWTHSSDRTIVLAPVLAYSPVGSPLGDIRAMKLPYSVAPGETNDLAVVRPELRQPETPPSVVSAWMLGLGDSVDVSCVFRKGEELLVVPYRGGIRRDKWTVLTASVPKSVQANWKGPDPAKKGWELDRLITITGIGDGSKRGTLYVAQPTLVRE